MKKTSRFFFAPFVLLALTSTACADMMWPSMMLEVRLLAWWVILLGLIAEYLFLRRWFKLDVKEAVRVDVVMNLVSGAVGFILIPMSGAVWEGLSGIIVNGISAVDIFDLITWAIAFVFAVLVNALVESLVVVKGFKHKVGRKGFRVLCLANMVSVFIAVVSLFACPPRHSSGRSLSNEVSTYAMLKQIASHEDCFFENDMDRNGTKDYWTADVTGFYALTDEKGELLKFIDIASARSDADPLKNVYSWELPASPSPRSGYYYRAMTLDEDGNSYQQDPDGNGLKRTNASKYAFCAFPDRYEIDGYSTFIVNEKRVVYGKEMEGKPVTTWPGKDPTQSGWEIME